MRLCEHADFQQAILQAAEHFRDRRLRPAIIEKDYYVTETLRIIAAVADEWVIFKGGTSLAKGWNLIRRFSEDIDIFLDPRAFNPALSKRGIDRELKKLRDAVAAHPALTFIKEESQTIGGFGRTDKFSYPQLFGGPGEVASRVVLEAGAACGGTAFRKKFEKRQPNGSSAPILLGRCTIQDVVGGFLRLRGGVKHRLAVSSTWRPRCREHGQFRGGQLDALPRSKAKSRRRSLRPGS